MGERFAVGMEDDLWRGWKDDFVVRMEAILWWMEVD
jgi:hypothetical protein